MDNLSAVANKVIDSSRANLLVNLGNLQPALAQLADSGKNIAGSLNILPTVPFPVNTVENGVVGDYGNLYLTLNLTVPELEKAWLTGTPLSSLTGRTSFAADQPATKTNNPVTGPLQNVAGSVTGTGRSGPGQSSTSGSSSETGSGTPGRTGSCTPRAPRASAATARPRCPGCSSKPSAADTVSLQLVLSLGGAGAASGRGNLLYR